MPMFNAVIVHRATPTDLDSVGRCGTCLFRQFGIKEYLRRNPAVKKQLIGLQCYEREGSNTRCRGQVQFTNQNALGTPSETIKRHQDCKDELFLD